MTDSAAFPVPFGFVIMCRNTVKWLKKVHGFWNYPLVELAGKTMGIIGFERIGQQTADIAQAFGMKVLGYDQYKKRSVTPKGF